MKNTLIALSAILVLVFTSCSGLRDLQFEKRHYNKGFYVHKKGDRNSASPEINSAEARSVAEVKNETEKPEATVAVVTPVNAPVAVETKTEKETSSVVIENNAVVMNPVHTPESVTNNKQQEQTTKTPATENTAAPDEDAMFIIMVILAFLISPLAVYLKEGVTTRFWLDLICWLLGGGLAFSPYFYGGALMLFAIVFALLIVLEVI